MSRRTAPWFAAGLLAVALAAVPSPAQPGNPWRNTPTNPWRHATAQMPTEDVAPARRPPHTHGVKFTIGHGPIKLSPLISEAAAPACCDSECKATVVAATPVGEKPSAAKLTGTWYREMPGTVTTITVTDTELKFAAVLNADVGQGKSLATVTLTADYSAAKDGTIHGIITGADVDVSAVENGPLSLELAGMSLMLQQMVDQPFALRCRLADGGLMVSSVRFPVVDGEMRDMGATLCGKYKPAAGKVPSPKPGLIINEFSSDPATRIPPTAGPVGYPPPPPPLPQYGPPDAITFGPPPVVPCPAQACPTPVRAGPPPEMRDTMTRVLNEMMFAPPPYSPYAALPPCNAPQACLPPAPVCPNPAVNPAGYTPPMLLPPPPLPTAAPVVPGQLPVGSWVRDVGPVRYVMAFKNGHLTVTATMTSENGEETVTHGMVLTADCYPTRDGSGLVGLVTSVDLTLDGPSMVDVADTLTDDLPKLQKILADQPLAMSFRVQDDVLVIGNVRLPSAGDNEMLEALAMGGRYKLSNGPLPKQKAAKAKAASGVVVGPVLGAGVGLSVGAATGNPKCGAVVGGMTLPSPRYLEHYPQYFSPDPNSPLPRELNSQVPAGQVERIGIDFSVNPPVVVAAPVVPASVPVVLPPAPAAKKPNPFRNGGVSDANARMQELLNDSEDLRHVGQEWRQFWFKDQPFIPPAAK